MRFLANENFPGNAVAALKAAGHDIVWVRTAAPGSKDKDILAWAEQEARVLLTFDKDFGELARHVGLPDYRCRQQLKSALFWPPGSVNERIGPDTSRLLNQGVSACARLRHNNFLD